MTTGNKVKIIYIAGAGRSGTTILDNTIALLPNVFTIGEGHFVWTRGIEENLKCGCKKEFKQCSFWEKVIQRLKFRDVQTVARYLSDYSNHELPWSSFGLVKNEEDRVLEQLDALYKSVLEVSGCNTIVDSSKFPSYGVLISKLPSVDLKVIHVTRDPRGVVNSWKKKKEYEPGTRKYIKRHGLLSAIIEWLVWNLSFELRKQKMGEKILRIRYEDFCKEPEAVINKIAKFSELNYKKVLTSGNKVDFKENHCVAGNPSRFKRGEIEIRKDIAWHNNLNFIEKITIVLLTFPWMIFYGYGFTE